MDFDKPKVYGDTFISDGLVSNVKASEKWCRPFLTKVIIIAQKRPKFSAIINCMVRTSIDSASLDNKFFLIILR